MLSMAARVFLVSALLCGCAVLADEDPLGVAGQSSGSELIATAGQQVAFGTTMLRNDTADDAFLVSARLVPTGASGGAEPIAVHAVDTLDVVTPLGAGVWPEDGDYSEASLQPVGGRRVRADSAVQLLFVVDVREAGRWGWAGVQVEYIADGLPHSAFAANEFVVCADLLPDCESLANP